MNESLLSALSALADGRATPEEWRLVEAAWAQDPELRERWLAWHQVGDALRAPELGLEPALPPEQLLRRLRDEADVVSVTGIGRARADRSRRAGKWLPPLAVAASFVAFAMLMGQWQQAPGGEPALAIAPLNVELPPVATSFAQRAVAIQTPDFGLVAAPRGTIVDGASWTPPPLWPESGASGPRP